VTPLNSSNFSLSFVSAFVVSEGQAFVRTTTMTHISSEDTRIFGSFPCPWFPFFWNRFKSFERFLVTLLFGCAHLSLRVFVFVRPAFLRPHFHRLPQPGLHVSWTSLLHHVFCFPRGFFSNPVPFDRNLFTLYFCGTSLV